MNSIMNVTYEVGEVLTPLKSAKVYDTKKKFDDIELMESAEGLRQVSALSEVTNFEIAFRLLAVKEHAKNAEQLGKAIGVEKANIYEFSKAITGKSKGRTSEYIKVAETFRYRDDTTKYIPNKEKYYLDEVASRFNFDTLLLVAKSEYLELLSDKYQFLETLPESVTALEVKDKLRELAEGENTEGENTENAEVKEVTAIDFNDMTKTMQDRLRTWLKSNGYEGETDIRIYNITM